jgi:hypothetical protein
MPPQASGTLRKDDVETIVWDADGLIAPDEFKLILRTLMGKHVVY